jgi:hypothetical protein
MKKKIETQIRVLGCVALKGWNYPRNGQELGYM